VSFVHRDGTAGFRFDQRATVDGWCSLGVFAFDAGTGDALRVGGSGANGRINADGARFLWRGSAGDAVFAHSFER
jgi:hypothetical protein